MKTFRFSLLLTVSLLIASTLLQTAVSGSTPQRAVYLTHYVFYVEPRGFVRYNFNICEGCDALISFYIYDVLTGRYSDIVFRVLAPDGWDIHPKTKIYSELSWSFTATRGGNYTFEFDNKYSTLSKWVSLALVVISPPPIESIIYKLVGFSVASIVLGIVIGYTLRRIKR